MGEASAGKLCPRTRAILQGIEAVSGHHKHFPHEETALFSWLTPGTHLRPHCGPTNTHLTCHLGITIPPGCKIRVGHEWRDWEEGKCIVFDDSFEHEVRHDGDRTRIVLLIRFWHPDVSPQRRAEVLRER